MCGPEHCSRGKMEKAAALQPHSSKEASESLSFFLPQPAAVFTGSLPSTLSVSTPDSYDYFSPSHQGSGCLSPSRSSEQDDLTCLSWLHQTQNLLPLQPLSRNPILSRPLSPVQQLPSSPVKPPYSFSSLIFMAIEDSAEKRLPVKDIYRWIVNNFPYYREAQGGWRNSVRHNLSLSKSFQRLNRDMGHSIGKGSLWRVCPEYRPALLEVLRKTHSTCQRTSDNLLKNISLLGADYNGQTTISETMDISDFDSLSSNPPCSLTPDHEELVHIDPCVELTEAIGEDAEKDPLADSGYIELHYYQYQQYQYLVVPGDTDLETVEILQLDAEAQEAAGSLLDLAGGNRKF